MELGGEEEIAINLGCFIQAVITVGDGILIPEKNHREHTLHTSPRHRRELEYFGVDSH